MSDTGGIDRSEVVRLRTAGLTLAEIAGRLECSVSGVRYHLMMDATADDQESRAEFLRSHQGRRLPEAVCPVPARGNRRLVTVSVDAEDWELLYRESRRRGVAIGELGGRLLGPALADMRRNGRPTVMEKAS